MIQCQDGQKLTELEQKFNTDVKNVGLTYAEGCLNQGDDETVDGVKIHIDEAVDLFDSNRQLTDEKTGCLVLGEEEFDKLYDDGKGIIPNAGVEIGDTGTCWMKAGKKYVLFFEFPEDASDAEYRGSGHIQIGKNAYFSLQKAGGYGDPLENRIPDDEKPLNKKMEYNKRGDDTMEGSQWSAPKLGEALEDAQQPDAKGTVQKSSETAIQKTDTSPPANNHTPNQSTQTGGRASK